MPWWWWLVLLMGLGLIGYMVYVRYIREEDD